jgi:hypothetical protein
MPSQLENTLICGLFPHGGLELLAENDHENYAESDLVAMNQSKRARYAGNSDGITNLNGLLRATARVRAEVSSSKGTQKESDAYQDATLTAFKLIEVGRAMSCNVANGLSARERVNSNCRRATGSLRLPDHRRSCVRRSVP